MDRRRVRGFIRPPSKDEVRQLAASMYYNLTDDETDELTLRAAQALSLIDRIDDLPQTRFDVKYPRTPGYRPTPEEDPLNRFVTKCEIKGAPTGKLAGKRVAVKDNIAVAGVPMTAASRAMIGYVPDFDAVVVERLLDAGATIVGKLNQDDMSSAGVADTSGFGPARNPANPEYSSGGSSSGSGAVVLAGEADLSRPLLRLMKANLRDGRPAHNPWRKSRPSCQRYPARAGLSPARPPPRFQQPFRSFASYLRSLARCLISRRRA